MNKYLTIFKLTIKEYFVYRLNFVLWRVRMFLSFILIFFIWFTIFESRPIFAGYSRPEMLSYLLFANLIANFVLGTRTVDLAGEINTGQIINLLLKPFSLFKYYLTRDMADKLMNIVFAFFEVSLLIVFFKIPIVPLGNPLLFLIFFINGVFISFYINLIISFFGFWTVEAWAPRFIFMALIFFLSGTYFPLDLLPSTLYHLLLLTPFPYLFYLPTKVLIGKADQLIYFQFFMSFIWVFAVRYLSYRLWHLGNRSFSFWGR